MDKARDEAIDRIMDENDKAIQDKFVFLEAELKTEIGRVNALPDAYRHKKTVIDGLLGLLSDIQRIAKTFKPDMDWIEADKLESEMYTFESKMQDLLQLYKKPKT